MQQRLIVLARVVAGVTHHVVRVTAVTQPADAELVAQGAANTVGRDGIPGAHRDHAARPPGIADFDRVDDDMGAAIANVPHLDAAPQRPRAKFVEPPLEQPLGLELRQ